MKSAAKKSNSSRLVTRDFDWYVLCVPPQKELAVEKIMGTEGFATFVPVTIKYDFANGAAKARMIKTEIRLPIMPRYVFLGMASGKTPGWDRVFCYTGIFNKFGHRIATGVLGVDGKPCQVRHDQLRKFMIRHNSGAFNAPSYHKHMKTHLEFEVGDQVVTEDELFTGRVIDITDDRARVFISIFGGGHVASIPLEHLVAI